MSLCSRLFLSLTSPALTAALPSSSPWVPVVIEKAPRQKPLSINHGTGGRMLRLEKSSSRRMARLLGAGLTPAGCAHAPRLSLSLCVSVCPCVPVCSRVCPRARLSPAPWGHAASPGGSPSAPLPLPGGFDASPCLCKYWQRLGSAWEMQQCLGKGERVSSPRLLAGMPSLISAECRAFAIGCAGGFFCAA